MNFPLDNLIRLDTNTACAQEEGTDPPQTVAEESDFKSTSRSSQVVQFVDWSDKTGEHVNRFVWGKTVEGRDMIGAIVSRKPYELGQKDERNVVLLLGNIHSGECAGKEALLMMLRELTLDPAHRWLDDNVIIFAPNYNADGNDRMGKKNRRSQIGPENGMGMRENAQQLDLNRDFIKIESPEARSLVELINKTNPHLFVDCHTTNGSKHQYCLTYDVPHNPSTAEPIRKFLRSKMLPAVTKSMAENDKFIFYYGNFNGDQNKWTTYGHEPRYSTEYVGLRGRLAILSEAYAYSSYKDRIFDTKEFVSGLLDYMTEHHETVHQLLEEVDRELIEAGAKQPQRIQMALSSKVASFDEPVMIKGYKDDQPHDYECEFVGKYEPITKTQLPYAYVIPASRTRSVDRLLMHGIQVKTLSKEMNIEVSIDTFSEVDRAARAFQKHKMVRAQSQRRKEKRKLAAGSYVVTCNQPLARLASYMLEAGSDDGLVVWNFLDDVAQVGKEHPIVRIDNPVELDSKPVTKVKKVGRIELDMIDGPNSLLATPDRLARWHGRTNQIKGQLWGNDFLVDIETGAFNGSIQPPFELDDVRKGLQVAGCDENILEDLVTAKPTLAINKKSGIYSAKGHSYLFHAEFGAIKLGEPESECEMFSYNKPESALAYVRSNVLQVLPLVKETFTAAKPVTPLAAKTEEHFVGKLDWVYQEELYGRGNFKGFWFNSPGDRVAFLELDESPVLPYTVVDHIPTRGKSEITNYPKAGDPLPKINIHVSSLDGKQIHQVDLSKYEGTEILISRVTWTQATNQLLIQVQNREQTWLDLIATDAEGKNPTVLFRDQTSAWIESPGDPIFLKDGGFIWLSPRDGYKHLYLYSANGSEKQQLTDGNWEVRSLIGIDPQFEYVYFTAAKETPYNMDAYRVSIDEGEVTRITKGEGTHAIDMSDDFRYFLDHVSTATKRTQSYVCKSDGTVLRRLNASNDDRLNYLNINKPEFVEVPSDSSQPMAGFLIKPPNFDPEKTYPVMVHIYGGPQTPRVRNRFGGEWYLWHQMLAQEGYIVWLCDNRSASYRSAKEAWKIHKNLAEAELADIEAGVQWLKDQPFVDRERIGVWGWSYGGYMTAYAMTRSKTFKMGICGAPVTDWKNYDAIYTERYMDTPQNNPEGYSKTSVLPNAKDLHGRMLLIHGTIDDNVHISNSMQLIHELQKANKQFDLMVYPKNRHSVRDEQQQAHLRRLMTDFIKKNL